MSKKVLIHIGAKTNLKFKLDEIIAHKDLIKSLIKKDLIVQYKQTILGPLWFLLQPIIYTLIFTFVFGKIANISTDKIPPFLFYMSGMVSWTFFSNSFGAVSNSFTANINLFSKIYFPRFIVVITSVLTSFIQFILQFSFFIIFYLYFIFNDYIFDYSLKYLLLIPLAIIQIMILSSGTGMIISSLTAKYRDLKFTLNMIIQIWLFLTPIVYPLSSVPEKYKLFYYLNPMTSVVEIFKKAFFNTNDVSLSLVLSSILISIILLLIGVYSFNKTQKNFIDTV